MSVIKKAFISSIPVLTGYVVLGMGFGIILKTNGYSVLWALAMSVFIYAGSMQYVGIGLITSGAGLLTVALTTLAVNARHLFYGISMVDRYRGAGASKPYIIFGLTDETYSLVCGELPDIAEKDRYKYYFYVSIMNQCYWVTGSVLGSLIGSVLKFNSEGIDFALTALFITVMTDQWLKTKNHVSAIIGVVSSVVSLLVFGTDSFLIPAMIMITIMLLGLRKYTGGEANE